MTNCDFSHQGSECGGFRCSNCGRESDNPFRCPCGAGQANHVLLVPDVPSGFGTGGYDDYDQHSAENEPEWGREIR